MQNKSCFKCWRPVVRDKDFPFIAHHPSYPQHHHKVCRKTQCYHPSPQGLIPIAGKKKKKKKKKKAHVTHVKGFLPTLDGRMLHVREKHTPKCFGKHRRGPKPRAPVCLSGFARLYARMCRQAGGTSHRRRQPGALIYHQTVIRRTFF